MPTPSPCTNAFIGKVKAPSNAELDKALGPAKKSWSQLLADLAVDGIDVQEWGSSSKKLGWSLRVKRDDRVIVYLAPSEGCFLASFALGSKAMQAARQSGLPHPAIKIMDEAKRHAEGTAVRLDVRSEKDAAVVRKLAKAELEN